MSKKKQIWNQILRCIKSDLKETEFKTWFSNTSLIEMNGERAVIGVHHKFIRNWLEEKYLPEIKKAFRSVLRHSPEICFMEMSGRPNRPGSKSEEPLPYPSSNLDPSMTFHSFITGTSNQFAYTSALEVAKRAADSYNPLYIYSEPGLGKTHLLNAVGNFILGNNPSLRVIFLSSDAFTSDFTFSVRNGKLHEFREKYCTTDILLFDDIHLLSNRFQTQEEFLYIFNTLHEEKRQIVVSGNTPPTKLKKMKPQLVSRLGWGLLTEILPPDHSTKIEIINAKARGDKLHIPDDVLFFLANSTDNIKTLVNNVVRFGAFASLNGGKINLSMAKSLVNDGDEPEVNIENIKSTVAGYFNISPDDLNSGKKKRVYSFPRQVAMYLLKKYTSLTYQQIGDVFGRKNHSTVIYAVKRISRYRKEDRDVRDQLDQLEKLLS
ncbi:MAG: chromosomal replication initiator protein DnaA [Deltaproteobacteria bacterium]|nr:chromosomal replication initiator protein DnaA [Deltaproteobacteria bacterium]